MPDDLREALETVRKQHQLKEIGDDFSSDLEISYFTNEVQRRRGPALLFTNVDGGDIPVLMNLFGTEERFETAIGRTVTDLQEDVERILSLFSRRPGLKDGLRLFGEIKNFSTEEVSSAPVKEITGDISLSDLPILKTWKGDAGRFITLPVVITKDPETGVYNAGTYRMQVFDGETTGMHWQAQKTGAMHLKSARKVGKPLEVAVAIGVHPSIIFSSISPLPDGMDEISFAGFIRGERVKVVKGDSVGLRYPAEAEIILEGYVDPLEIREEGPFGDHTGYYTPVDLYPVFHIKKIYHRKNPIYHSTVVGKLWNEDVIIGRAIEKMFLPAIKFQFPEVVDLFLPEEGLFNSVCFVSIRKKYSGQGRKVGMAILSSGQMMFTKYVVVVDEDINVRDRKSVLWAVSTRTDPYRDVELIKLSVADSLDHASMFPNSGGKMIVDATVKTKEEGFNGTWPEVIESPNSKEWTDMMKKYGL